MNDSKNGQKSQFLMLLLFKRQIPYIYVPSKHDLGAASLTKRPTSCILVSPKESFSENALYDKLAKEAQTLASIV